MPVCFSLTRKGETEPTVLQRLDEELCAHLNVPVDPDRWVDGWYNSIGFHLAVGTPLDSPDLDARAKGRYHLPAILAYLRANFTADCWREG